MIENQKEFDYNKVKLSKRMMDKENECAKLINHFEYYIPKNTLYCDNPDLTACPFYDKHIELAKELDSDMMCGYCHLIHIGDWFSVNDINGDCVNEQLLFDHCKECGFFEFSEAELTEEEKKERDKEIEELKKNWKKCNEYGKGK
jgi:hypothetical protein